jgi:alkyl hydroperoxide reductase subunit D
MATALESIDGLLDKHDSKIARDLKLNLKNLITKSALTMAEAGILVRGVARTLHHPGLSEIGLQLITDSNETLSAEQYQEIEESAAIMGMLNVYYRFRHFMESQETQHQAYQNAGLRMQSLAAPALGKERFELLAFAHSVINGCEKCVTSHERSLVELGTAQDKIHDAARVAAVCTGISRL